ncbi:aminotransferase class V-fold PLP-dependent enzyme [Phenylobacterium sp.]|uniref:aminotransferase class V-fold PLP-dependent enzyme n=1 Tax=Phenylobacterium sp. TaxID=1871053 RepID=UPI0012202627|nr:aminotransferase class V-fold PLP-dependent enzyme [Phenylobacterium sp.]THD61009.1 MAG: aminotransferase class V-fold PLP-dependent enzyme [Phenylobacterium sp.]
MTGGPDWAAFRALFPTLERKAYLASGSYGLLGRPVEAAMRLYLEDRLEKGVDWGGWGERHEAVRGGVAALLNAHPDEIAVTTSASAGINALASALEFSGPRNKVAVSNLEFPTGAQIWHAQEPRGAVVEHIPEDGDGFIPLEHFERAIDEHTRLVALTHVGYRNGARVDVEGVVRIAHERGALVLLDIFQSVGALEIDLTALGVDFAVGGMLKYLLGTAGVGFLYVARPHIAALTPTASGWFAQADIGAMDIFANRPSPTARRFEAGTPPVSNCYAAEAGIDLIRQIGIGPIAQRVRETTGEAMDRLADAGCTLATPRDDRWRGPQVAIRSTDAAALAERLAARGVVVSWREDKVRAMFHAYNTGADTDALIEGLLAHRDLLA